MERVSMDKEQELLLTKMHEVINPRMYLIYTARLEIVQNRLQTLLIEIPRLACELRDSSHLGDDQPTAEQL
jgi:hypothetical protein